MGATTFSGPVRAGNRRGSDSNVGNVVLAQTYDSGDLDGTGTGNIDSGVVMRIPAGSQIVDIIVDQTEAASGGTTTVSVGTAAGGAQLMAAVATTAGGRFRGTATAATQAAWQISASADAEVHVRNVVASGALTAGQFVVTILYIQR